MGRTSGNVIHPFVELHYPCYLHYDILFGLLVMAESGHIEDGRCCAALELLESKGLSDGGFARFICPIPHGSIGQAHRSPWTNRHEPDATEACEKSKALILAPLTASGWQLAIKRQVI